MLKHSDDLAVTFISGSEMIDLEFEVEGERPFLVIHNNGTEVARILACQRTLLLIAKMALIAEHKLRDVEFDRKTEKCIQEIMKKNEAENIENNGKIH